MNESFRIGHVAGVRVGANWSVLVIFFLLWFGLAAGNFPITYPDLPTWLYVLAGGVAAVMFFLSLLAHEMAHALVARRVGLGVRGITLWMFGGVAFLDGDPPDATSDLRIAGVGPLVSLLLAGVFAAVAWLFEAAGITGIWQGVFRWLAVINGALAVFNLMPAAPLDGGRVLRGILWRRHGDRYRAAVSATRAGRVFGFLLVGVGLAEIVFLPGIGGLWLVLVGWFIINAAGAEEQHARLRQALGDVHVADVMTAHPVTVPTGLTVQQLLDEYVLQNRFSAFPVVDPDGRPSGLVTLNRIKQVAPDQRASVLVSAIACPVGDVTEETDGERTPRVVPSQPVAELLPQLNRCADGRALVVDEVGRVVGIVSPTDIARMLQLASLRSPTPHAHV